MSGFRVIERDDRDRLGEGPLWSSRENALYWVDILAPRLNRLSLGDGEIRTWDMPAMIGWVIEREHQPGFIAGFQTGFAELSLDPFGVRHMANPEPDLPDNRLNDAKADSRGRIWAGTMPVSADLPTGALYRLDRDRNVTAVDVGYTIANGPALSPDERFLYHTDTAKRLIYRFTLGDDGTLHDRQPFIRFEQDWGTPDGMTVDVEGGLWVAHWGAGCISRFSPQGIRERVIPLPASQITSCTFAGEALDRMFVTSAADGCENEPLAGALFEVSPDICGLPPQKFAG